MGSKPPFFLYICVEKIKNMSNNDTAAGCLAALVASAGFIGIWFVLSLIFAWPVQLLWNWLIPVIFAGPKITIMQAFGLEILSGLLFGRSTTTTTSSK